MVVIYFNQLFGHNRPPICMLVYTSLVYFIHPEALWSSINCWVRWMQRRRAQKCTSVDIIFHDDMPTTTTQAAFLTNGNNKKRLIESLREKMLQAGIRVKQAEADADTLIV